MTSIIFVTGTNTDVGKTIATASALSATAHRIPPQCSMGLMKPAQTGEVAVTADNLGEWDGGDRGDLAVITRLLREAEPDVQRWKNLPVWECVRYPEPLAPDVAARRAHQAQLSVEQVGDRVLEVAAQVDVLFVEGAGGLLVGLGTDATGVPVTLLDVAAYVSENASVRGENHEVQFLVVSQPDLGMLNHCLLTIREIYRRDIPVVGIVFGTWPRHPDLPMRLNAAEVERLTGVPVIAAIPQGVGDNPRLLVESPEWWTSLPWLAAGED